MTAQEQIAKLESLLDRIRRNVSKPRTAAPLVARAPEPAPAPPPEAPAVAAPVVQAPPVVEAPPPVETRAEEAGEAIPDIEDLDMADVEVVEIAVDEGPALEAADEAPDTVDEPMPESAPRPAAALADVAEPEAPIKTPPPESGRQAVAPAIHEEPAREADLSGAGDVDSLLEADLTGGPISRAPQHGGPTMEQLGATVELQGADAPPAQLELDADPAARATPPPADELELELPKQGFGGAYDARLPPPVTAAEDLKGLQAERAAPPASFAPPVAAAPPPPAAPSEPTVVERPPLEAHAAEVIVTRPTKVPETFLDLLDASLGLRA